MRKIALGIALVVSVTAAFADNIVTSNPSTSKWVTCVDQEQYARDQAVLKVRVAELERKVGGMQKAINRLFAKVEALEKANEEVPPEASIDSEGNYVLTVRTIKDDAQ